MGASPGCSASPVSPVCAGGITPSSTTTETPPADPDRANLVPRTGVPLPTAAAINQWQWLRGAHAETLLVNAPAVSTAYNQWTWFEDFPQFMNGVKRELCGA